MGFITRLEKLEVESGVNGLRERHKDDASSILHPSSEMQRDALMAILDTMPDQYGHIVVDEVSAYFDADDTKWTWTPMTARAIELMWLKIYECPRTLALPEEFCRALTEPLEEPGDWVRWDWWACVDCHLAHPTYVHVPQYYENFQRMGSPVHFEFNDCVACGGQVSVRKPATQAPCHDSVGSPYRQAWADEGVRLRREAEENRK